MAKKAAHKKALASLIGDDKPRTRRPKVNRRTPRASAPEVDDEPQPSGSVIQIKGSEPTPHGYRKVRGCFIIGYPAHLATTEQGSKTPAVIEWYRENHPEAYKVIAQTNVG